MNDQKAYQEYIQRRYNAFCKAVIRYAWQRPSVPELCRAPHNTVVFPAFCDTILILINFTAENSR